MAQKLDPPQIVTFARLVLGLLVLSSLGSGCTVRAHPSLYETRYTSTGIESSDAVTMLLQKFSGQFSLSKEGEFSFHKEYKFFDCISEALHEAHPMLRIVPPDEFRRAAFPDLRPEEAPLNPEELASLVKQAAFKERIAPLGIRYLVSVWGETTVSPGPSKAWAIGFLSYLRAEGFRHSSLNASVLDLKEGLVAGNLQVSAGESSEVTLYSFVPFIKIAVTEGPACDKLGQAVTKFLSDENPPEEEGIWPAMAERSPVVYVDTLEEIEAEQFKEAPVKTEEETIPTSDPDATDWSNAQCC